MQHRSPELLYAAATMALIGLGYTAAVTGLDLDPAASGLLGHGLGIAGFALMLMTETLYSLRKRSRSARWGRTSSWLRLHIFTGLVGPFMVLLHAAWRTNGLAGAVMLLTVIVVGSGFVGRYVYTAVPRTADGVEVAAAELAAQIAAAEADLQRLLATSLVGSGASLERLASLPQPAGTGLLLMLGHTFLEWGYRMDLWREQRRWGAMARGQARELARLLGRRRSLRRQVSSLVAARRALATWHAVHIPLGVALFTAALVHIVAALYYATLLR
jgi:hypothetical protein